MISLKPFLTSALLAAGLHGLCAQTAATSKELKRFAQDFSGIYSSKAFSDTTKSPYLKEQETLIMPIFTKTDDERWFYFGWYAPNFKERPLEEIFVRVWAEENALKLDFHSIPDDHRNAKPWQNPEAYAELSPEQLAQSATNGRCLIFTEGKDDFEIRGYEDIQQKVANAGIYKTVHYHAFLRDGERFDSHIKLLNAEGKAVIDHEAARFYILKIKRKIKDFSKADLNNTN